MRKKPIVLKPYINKRTKQLTIILPKRELKKSHPKLKFGKNMFVKLEVFDKIKKRK